MKKSEGYIEITQPVALEWDDFAGKKTNRITSPRSQDTICKSNLLVEENDGGGGGEVEVELLENHEMV